MTSKEKNVKNETWNGKKKNEKWRLKEENFVNIEWKHWTVARMCLERSGVHKYGDYNRKGKMEGSEINWTTKKLTGNKQS